MIDLYNFLLAYTYILYNLYMKICVLSSSCMFTGAHPPPTKTTYPPKPPVSGNSLEAATAHHNGTRKRCSPLSKRRSLRITRREFNMEELASMIGWQWWMIFTENDSMYCVIYIYIHFFISEGKQMYLIIPHHIGAFYLWKWLRWLAMIETWSWWCLRNSISGKAGLAKSFWLWGSGLMYEKNPAVLVVPPVHSCTNWCKSKSF